MINDQPVTEMPTHCVRDECRRTASGGKLQSRKGFMVCDECGSSYGAAPADPGDDLLGDHLIAEAEREQASTPAEQPGKAADPRPSEDCPARDGDGGRGGLQVGDAIEGEACPSCNGTGADPRPAQPQAPAEPWRSPEGYTLVELLEQQAAFASGEGHMLSESELRAAAEHFREHPPEVAAPLREERDRERRLAKEWEQSALLQERRLRAADAERDKLAAQVAELQRATPSEAPLDALREALKHAQEELRDGFIVCSSCGHEEPTGDLDVLTVYIDPALSAPPPPSREPASAPPRKAPQEGPDDARAEEFRLGWNAGWLAGREAAAQEAGVRFGTAAEDALFALAAPSSPEEQLSGVKK